MLLRLIIVLFAFLHAHHRQSISRRWPWGELWYSLIWSPGPILWMGELCWCRLEDIFCAISIKSGYHHVDIHEECWPYLSFTWGAHSARKWYAFRVLPFGPSTACYFFTKLLRPLVKRWRSMGLRCVMYIDDGICGASSEQRCRSDTSTIVSDLEWAGFVPNVTKSRLKSEQVGAWLGFTLDFKGRKIFSSWR